MPPSTASGPCGPGTHGLCHYSLLSVLAFDTLESLVFVFSCRSFGLSAPIDTFKYLNTSLIVPTIYLSPTLLPLTFTGHSSPLSCLNAFLLSVTPLPYEDIG